MTEVELLSKLAAARIDKLEATVNKLLGALEALTKNVPEIIEDLGPDAIHQDWHNAMAAIAKAKGGQQ